MYRVFGARALSYKLKRKYTGVSENIVKGVLAKSKLYGRQYPKFSNKAPLKSINCKGCWNQMANRPHFHERGSSGI